MSFLAFNPVLPYGNHPEPIIEKDGKYWLQLYEYGAQQAEIEIEDNTYPMTSLGNGLFTMQLPFCKGFHYLQIKADGRETISPLLPIGYGYSRPMNYLDLMDGTEFFALKDVPHGDTRAEIYFSDVTGEWERCLIYTPPAYDQTNQIYPVLYLQHGHGENEIGWTSAGRISCILDNLIAKGQAVPFVVVMNNGFVQKKAPGAPGGHVTDHLLFEDLLLHDVIPFVEQKYRAGGNRQLRGIAGLSMGSIQTSILVCRHPEIFSEVGIFSGFLHDWISGSELDGAHHAESNSEYLDIFRQDSSFRNCFRTFFRGIGDQDPFLDYFKEDDVFLDDCNVKTERKIYQGSHDWNVWRNCMYDFAQLVFRTTGR